MQNLDQYAVQTNIHGILQQRRLWHIQSINARNLTTAGEIKSTAENDPIIAKAPFVHKANKLFLEISITDVDKEDIYSSNSRVILKSDDVSATPNPSWSFKEIIKSHDTARSKFVIKVWKKAGGDTTLLCKTWSIKLKKLVFVSVHLNDRLLSFAENSVIFQINGSFYTYSKWINRSSDDRPNLYPQFDLENRKTSSSFFNLKRIVANKRLIAQKLQLADNFTVKSEELLQYNNQISLLKYKLHEKKCKNAVLKKLVEKEMQSLDKKKQALDKRKAALSDRRTECTAINSKINELTNNKLNISSSYLCIQKKTNQAALKLHEKQKQLLSELFFIFPITHGVGSISKKVSKYASTVEVKQPKMRHHSICDIYLPESESMPIKEDMYTSIALGYVSQVLQILSTLLSQPLRYPIKLKGSHCQIYDNISEKLHEHERVFSLWGKGSKERYLFDYAIYMLNKNITQIRHLHGLPTQDLRPTLLNIKTLLEFFLQANPANTIRVKSPSLSKPSRQTPAIKQEKTNISDGKAVDLHNLRGELFSSSKRVSLSISQQPMTKPKVKPLPITSAQPEKAEVLAPSNIPHPSTATAVELRIIPDHFDVDNIPVKSKAAGKSLTGLEELGDKGKEGRPGKSVLAARSELFSTKYGTTTGGRKNRRFKTSPNTERRQPDQSKPVYFPNGQNLILPVINGKPKPKDSTEQIANNNNTESMKENIIADNKPINISVSQSEEELDLC